MSMLPDIQQGRLPAQVLRNTNEKIEHKMVELRQLRRDMDGINHRLQLYMEMCVREQNLLAEIRDLKNNR